MLQVMIQNIDMRAQMQDYNPIIAHKSDFFFFYFTGKLLKTPQTTPLYQLLKKLQKSFKGWRKFKEWQTIPHPNMHEQDSEGKYLRELVAFLTEVFRSQQIQ